MPLTVYRLNEGFLVCNTVLTRSGHGDLAEPVSARSRVGCPTCDELFDEVAKSLGEPMTASRTPVDPPCEGTPSFSVFPLDNGYLAEELDRIGIKRVRVYLEASDLLDGLANWASVSPGT